ncbi:MAG TPA: VOC family protein [Candidatus Binataceae bacterium]|nr:VOC family protein [Candidatus Binataceae bacterium]
MIKASLNHFHINVADLDRSARFYRQALGLHEDFREGTMLFLSSHTHQVITLHQTLPIGAAGLQHLGFRVDQGSLEEVTAAAVEAGGKFVGRGEHAPGYPYVYVADPDGYVIELAGASD